MVRKTSAKIAMIAKAPMSARVSRRAKRTKMTKEKNLSDMKRTIDQPTECLLCRRKFVSNRALSAEAYGSAATEQAQFFPPYPLPVDPDSQEHTSELQSLIPRSSAAF